MMSRNSCSKGLVRDCMKRNLWAIVLSTVGFFMAQLLPVVMTAQHSLSAHKQDLVNLSAADAAASWQGYVESVGEMLGGQNVFVKLAVIILAVTCGVSMFAYLHNRRKVDFYHSLPISRSRLFAVDYATGALCALVPYLVLHALSIVSACAMGNRTVAESQEHVLPDLCDGCFHGFAVVLQQVCTADSVFRRKRHENA